MKLLTQYYLNKHMTLEMIYIILTIVFFILLLVYLLYLKRKQIQVFLEDKVWQIQKTDSEYALI